MAIHGEIEDLEKADAAVNVVSIEIEEIIREEAVELQMDEGKDGCCENNGNVRVDLSTNMVILSAAGECSPPSNKTMGNMTTQARYFGPRGQPCL